MELRATLAYPKIIRRVTAPDAAQFVDWLARSAVMVPDPVDLPPVAPSDPGDAYLVALAAAQRAYLVSGDRAVLDLRRHAPVYSPVEFLELLAEAR